MGTAHVTRPTGIDAGATLTKLALWDGGELRLTAVPSQDTGAVLARLAGTAGPVAVTGGGAVRLARRLARDVVCVDEFEAWRSGVATLLGDTRPARFLLVSIGTGTSVLLVEGDRVRRLAGTPLGGGTLLGLGAALTGCGDFEALCQLAQEGDRARVDLSVADVYADGGAPLATDVMAASFARLGTGPHAADPPPHPADLAAALAAMVGENVALLAGSLALVTGVEHLVFGGTTLHGNPVLAGALADYVRRFDRKMTILERGGFAGAIGAACRAGSLR